MTTRLRHYEAATYRIRFQGAINESWVEYLDPDLTLQVNQNDQQSLVTTLTGKMSDQAALLGILNYLYSLGLPLLSVEHIA